MESTRKLSSRQQVDDERASAALNSIQRSIEKVDPLISKEPGLRDVINLLRSHEEAERQLGIQRSREDSTFCLPLEQSLVHAFLILSRPPLLNCSAILTSGLFSLRKTVSRTRFFLALTMLIFFAAFLVGLFAIESDSRIGDLLMLESAKGANIAAAKDPIGALLFIGLGRNRGSAFSGELYRLLLLYGLFTGGLLVAIPAVTAISIQGARLGSLFSAGAFDNVRPIETLTGGVPDFLCLLFVCTAGLVVAHSLLAWGESSFRQSLGGGLRTGVRLFTCGLIFHALMVIPVAPLRSVLALGFFIILTTPSLWSEK